MHVCTAAHFLQSASRWPANGDNDADVARVRIVVVEDYLSLLDAEDVAIAAGFDVVSTAPDAAEAERPTTALLLDMPMMDINVGGTRTGIDVVPDAWRQFGIRSLIATACSGGAGAALHRAVTRPGR